MARLLILDVDCETETILCYSRETLRSGCVKVEFLDGEPAICKFLRYKGCSQELDEDQVLHLEKGIVEEPTVKDFTTKDKRSDDVMFSAWIGFSDQKDHLTYSRKTAFADWYGLLDSSAFRMNVNDKDNHFFRSCVKIKPSLFAQKHLWSQPFNLVFVHFAITGVKHREELERFRGRMHDFEEKLKKENAEKIGNLSGSPNKAEAECSEVVSSIGEMNLLSDESSIQKTPSRGASNIPDTAIGRDDELPDISDKIENPVLFSKEDRSSSQSEPQESPPQDSANWRLQSRENFSSGDYMASSTSSEASNHQEDSEYQASYEQSPESKIEELILQKDNLPNWRMHAQERRCSGENGEWSSSVQEDSSGSDTKELSDELDSGDDERPSRCRLLILDSDAEADQILCYSREKVESFLVEVLVLNGVPVIGKFLCYEESENGIVSEDNVLLLKRASIEEPAEGDYSKYEKNEHVFRTWIGYSKEKGDLTESKKIGFSDWYGLLDSSPLLHMFKNRMEQVFIAHIVIKKNLFNNRELWKEPFTVKRIKTSVRYREQPAEIARFLSRLSDFEEKMRKDRISDPVVDEPAENDQEPSAMQKEAEHRDLDGRSDEGVHDPPGTFIVEQSSPPASLQPDEPRRVEVPRSPPRKQEDHQVGGFGEPLPMQHQSLPQFQSFKTPKVQPEEPRRVEISRSPPRKQEEHQVDGHLYEKGSPLPIQHQSPTHFQQIPTFAAPGASRSSPRNSEDRHVNGHGAPPPMHHQSPPHFQPIPEPEVTPQQLFRANDCLALMEDEFRIVVYLMDVKCSAAIWRGNPDFAKVRVGCTFQCNYKPIQETGAVVFEVMDVLDVYHDNQKRVKHIANFRATVRICVHLYRESTKFGDWYRRNGEPIMKTQQGDYVLMGRMVRAPGGKTLDPWAAVEYYQGCEAFQWFYCLCELALRQVPRKMVEKTEDRTSIVWRYVWVISEIEGDEELIRRQEQREEDMRRRNHQTQQQEMHGWSRQY